MVIVDEKWRQDDEVCVDVGERSRKRRVSFAMGSVWI